MGVIIIGKFQSLVGQRFGRLVVLERVGTYVQPCGSKSPTYRCICDCGNETVVPAKNLRSGNTQSCGCKKRNNVRFEIDGVLYSYKELSEVYIINERTLRGRIHDGGSIDKAISTPVRRQNNT